MNKAIEAAQCTTRLCHQTAHAGIHVQATWAGMIVFLFLIAATVHIVVTEVLPKRRRARLAAAVAPETAAEPAVGLFQRLPADPR